MLKLALGATTTVTVDTTGQPPFGMVTEYTPEWLLLAFVMEGTDNVLVKALGPVQFTAAADEDDVVTLRLRVWPLQRGELLVAVAVKIPEELVPTTTRS